MDEDLEEDLEEDPEEDLEEDPEEDPEKDLEEDHYQEEPDELLISGPKSMTIFPSGPLKLELNLVFQGSRALPNEVDDVEERQQET